MNTLSNLFNLLSVYGSDAEDNVTDIAAGIGFSVIFAVLVGIILVAIVLGVYFLPTIIALAKRHCNKGAITVLNIFLGFTYIGWVIALIWAVKKPERIVIVNQPAPVEEAVAVAPAPEVAAASTVKYCTQCGTEYDAAKGGCPKCAE